MIQGTRDPTKMPGIGDPQDGIQGKCHVAMQGPREVLTRAGQMGPPEGAFVVHKFGASSRRIK